jgi:hypothetical protein
MRLARHHADIGQDHDRDMFAEKGSYRIGGGRVCLADIRKGGKRLGEIIGWCEQRLCEISRFAADETGTAATPALVEKENRRCRMFASDFETGNLIAQFDGHLEFGLRLVGPGEIERSFAERKPLAVERTDNALLGAGERRAEHTHIETAGLVLRARERANGCLICHEREFAGKGGKLARELPRMAAIKPVSDPNNGRLLMGGGIFFNSS